MNPLKLFIKRFTGKDIMLGSDIFVVENKYFLITKRIREFLNYIKTKSPKLNPFYAGTYLGKSKGRTFFPSINLLNIIAKHTRNKVMLNRQQEWLYVCGRDILDTRRRGKFRIGEQVLLMSEQGECVGFGRISDKRKVYVENVLDIGDFLRRER